MTPAELDAIVRQHGGIAGSIAVDPYVSDETGKIKEKNFTPQYKLTFRDGTSLTVRPQATWTDDSGEANIQGWDITDAGTAFKTPASASTTSQWVTKVDPQTNITYRVNEATGQKDELFGAAPPKTSRWLDSFDGSEWLIDEQGNKVKQLSPANPNWTPGLGVRWPKDPPQYAPQYPNVITHGTGAYKVDPYTGAVEQVYDFGQAPPTEQELWQRGQQERQLAAQESNWAKQYKNQRDQLASNLADWWTQRQIQAAPYAMLPGQTEFLGAGLGRKMEGRLGLPEGNYSVSPMKFDPVQAWRLAQEQTGG